jgi:hypothetical protein
MTTLLTIIHGIYWLVYQVCSRLPGAAKLGALLPRWLDTFTPAAFFTAPVHLPVATNIKFAVQQSGASIIPLQHLSQVRGVVTAVEVRPPNATWPHQTFYIKPDDPTILNSFNRNNLSESYPGMNGCLKCCTPVTDLDFPKVGQRVYVYGTFGLDLANGWTILEYAAGFVALT